MSEAVLYIVATPIGNLDDLSPRALRVLSEVDLVAAEDTRHSARLMQHYGINTPMWAVHDHNERAQTDRILARLRGGENIALISDAGTPLISDPGFTLVRAVRQAGFRVVPVPGPCALITALCAAGLPTDRFRFEGFLPAKRGARQALLEQLREETATWVVYESPHRIRDSLEDMRAVLGEDRFVVLARELTKTFETIHGAPLGELIPWLEADSNRQRGEFVVLVQGAEAPDRDALDPGTLRTLKILLEELPLKQAAALAARLTGVARKRLYQEALRLQDEGQEGAR